MKLKYIIIVVFTACFYSANAQTKIEFSTFKNKFESIQFTSEKMNSTKITSLKTLSKIGISRTWNEDFNVMNSIKNFNWATDAYRNESYKRMFYNLYKHDRYGREFLSNINEGIINQIYLKNATFDY